MTEEDTRGVGGRFVVLEHRWRGVHWDFMLERGGVLATWALSAAPGPESEAEASPLPDHRLAYLDYEGPISGDRGEVRRLDRGTYESIQWEEDRVVVRLLGDQVIGEAELLRGFGKGRCSWRFRMGKFI
ncbi:DNA polymerase ligase N-terminal domain-containing protein [Tautonia sociabilis]|uniref:DNA ligase D 3'-phosphoesterase domain-containing protein n=1 Tax=Tautonia sociabilis TaxID=2080755 RepID=A0A432MN95_9BACT|nr:DNA polymerase ligase N-terminal domain-containing protein [Tautonia sociabilis]RUL88914.1 hypothetical protein TsocGM_04775 [Tautonia sociabilis]